MAKKKKKAPKHEAPYLTYALAEDYKREKLNTTIPSEDNVLEAKEWVDENKK